MGVRAQSSEGGGGEGGGGDGGGHKRWALASTHCSLIAAVRIVSNVTYVCSVCQGCCIPIDRR